MFVSAPASISPNTIRRTRLEGGEAFVEVVEVERGPSKGSAVPLMLPGVRLVAWGPSLREELKGAGGPLGG